MRRSRKNAIYISIYTILSIASLKSWAAPIPATSSSEYIKADLGKFRSELGFEIDASKTSWKQHLPPENNKYINTIYKSPKVSANGIHGALTVRTNTLEPKLTFSKYVQSWIKDYPRLGFTVLTAKKVSVNKQRGFLIDLINKNSAKQLRQVLFHQKNKVVILTCRDHRTNFLETVKSCNQIIRNFSW